ncbi:hypothetical protein ACGP04_11100 [Piscirickettsia salmonis]|uniref:hypothetical protein n=1 Tax=Piscirickettsia salmonis TaxID=1238 RepID=UPI0037511192
MLPKFEDIHKKAQDFINHFIQKKNKGEFWKLSHDYKEREKRDNLLFQIKDDIDNSRSVYDLLKPLGTIQRNELTQKYLTYNCPESTQLKEFLDDGLNNCEQYLDNLIDKRLNTIKNKILSHAQGGRFQFGWGGSCYSIPNENGPNWKVPRRVQCIYEAITGNLSLSEKLTIVNDLLATARPGSGYKAGLLWFGKTQGSTTNFLQSLDCPELH